MSSIIKQLDPVTITQIAAGEVIDRPASIVKELIENALDAGATQISIVLEDGGKRRIKVIDNGRGLSPEDLPLAPLQHTTSKITVLEDLYHTPTFGFRGEALASISHVAKLTITSKQEGADCYQIRAYKGDIGTPTLSSGSLGTVMDVQDLFDDIPVRQKFLKSASTELSYISDSVMQFAVSLPHIDFVLSHEGQDIINSKGISDARALLVHFYGKALKDHLVRVDTDVASVRFKGYITDPQFTFGNKTKQIVTVNRRLVKSPSLYKALQDSFKDLIPHRRFPLAVLDITLDSELVDVNIHPQKLDVKFLNPGFLYNALPKAISLSLQSNTSLAPVLYPLHDVSPQSPPVFAPPTFESFAFNASPIEDVIPQTYTPKMDADNIPHFSTSFSNLEPISTPLTPEPRAQDIAIAAQLFTPTQLTPPRTDFTHFQLFDTYIVIQGQDALYLMDQHAVHERILYEKIKDSFGTQSDRQPLLLSEIIELTPDLIQVFEHHQAYLESLQFVIDPFGPGKIAVREIPYAFSDSNITILVTGILHQLQEFPDSIADMTLQQKEVLQLKACKAAIKAGKKLHPLEVKRLVQDLMASPANYTCPHGRPLYIKLDQNRLEKLFLRS